LTGIKTATIATETARLKVSSQVGVKKMKTLVDGVFFFLLLACVLLAFNAPLGPLLFLGIVAVLALTHGKLRALLAPPANAPIRVTCSRPSQRRRSNS